jgi:hypothetical protein
MKRTALIAAIALVAGLVAGYFAGRLKLLHEWSQPVQLLHSDSRGSGADPAPREGTRGFRPMPYARTRLAAREFTARDPVVLAVGSVGRGDEGAELHVTLRNRGACEASELEGVAYGFDAYGTPSRLNRGGEHFVAFSARGLRLAPGAAVQQEIPLHNVGNASLVLAHVDRVTCADGTRWARQ